MLSATLLEATLLRYKLPATLLPASGAEPSPEVPPRSPQPSQEHGNLPGTVFSATGCWAVLKSLPQDNCASGAWQVEE